MTEFNDGPLAFPDPLRPPGQGLTVSALREPNLFISHNSQEKPFVRNLAHALNYYGLDAWIDEWEIAVGHSLHQTIGSALEYAKFVGVVVSPGFVGSRWCMDELQQALAREKRTGVRSIVPILFKAATLPPFLEDRLYIDFRASPYRGLVQLCGMLYGATPKQISDELAANTFASRRDVSRSLKRLGWNGWRFLRPHDMAALSALLSKAGFDIPNGKQIALTVDMIVFIKERLATNVLLGRLFKDHVQGLDPATKSAGRPSNDVRPVPAAKKFIPQARRGQERRATRGGLSGLEIPAAAIESVPETVARECCIIPYAVDQATIHVYISDPSDRDTMDKLRFILNRDVRFKRATRAAILKALDRWYGTGGEVEGIDLL